MSLKKKLLCGIGVFLGALMLLVLGVSILGAGSTATMREAIPANPSPVCPAPLATSQTDSTCGRSSWSRASVGLLMWTSLLAYRSAKASKRWGEEVVIPWLWG